MQLFPGAASNVASAGVTPVVRSGSPPTPPSAPSRRPRQDFLGPPLRHSPVPSHGRAGRTCPGKQLRAGRSSRAHRAARRLGAGRASLLRHSGRTRRSRSRRRRGKEELSSPLPRKQQAEKDAQPQERVPHERRSPEHFTAPSPPQDEQGKQEQPNGADHGKKPLRCRELAGCRGRMRVTNRKRIGPQRPEHAEDSRVDEQKEGVQRQRLPQITCVSHALNRRQRPHRQRLAPPGSQAPQRFIRSVPST
jgi:hypothetical protein